MLGVMEACSPPRRCWFAVVGGVLLWGALSVCGGGCGGGGGVGGGVSVLSVRTPPGWSTQTMGQRFETRYRPVPTQPEVVGESSVSPQTQLTLSGTMAARRVVATTAAELGLEPVALKTADVRSGWTEVYGRADGARVRVREEELGRRIEVEVREGSGRRIRPVLEERLGVEGR